MSKIGYSYKEALSKLLGQTSIPLGFTLRDIILLVELVLKLVGKSTRTLKSRKINRKI